MKNPTPSPAWPVLTLPSALGLIFITLRLTGHIDWPWWVVLSPFWVPFALFILVVTLVTIAYLVANHD